jgi:hypothetical protein
MWSDRIMISRLLIKAQMPRVDVSLSDICVKDQEKCNDARSISMMNTVVSDWFRPSRIVIALGPVLLYYDVNIGCPRYVTDCYFYILENRLIDTTDFRLCYNSHKHAPDQDSTLGCTQPPGRCSYWVPGPGKYL